MVVEGVVRGVPERCWDCASKEKRINSVVVCICVVLVKSKHHKCVVHEIGIVEQRCEEGPSPICRKGDRGIVSVVGHVGSDKTPLWKGLRCQIRLERSEILDQTETSSIVSDGLVDDQRVVLSDVVVIRRILLVCEVETEVPGVWDVFLVFSPGDAFCIEQIDNC